ncbi:MAG: hypothetical protein ABGX38_01990 [Thermoleophilia bacterium]|jgi:hypothetical protein
MRQPSPRARQNNFVARRADALSTPVDLSILMNGPGAYRLAGDQAATWGMLFGQFVLIP